MIIKGVIRIRMGHLEFNCHCFFFVHIAGWPSCTHQHQLLVFQHFLGVFDVTRFIYRLGSLAFQLALRLLSIRILVAFRSHFVRISFALRSHFVRISFAFIRTSSAFYSHFIRIYSHLFAFCPHFVRILIFAFIRISSRIHRRRAQLTGGIRTHLTSCIQTHQLGHLPMTLEVLDSKIKATCFFGQEQSTERNKAIHPNSIVINVFFFCQIM